MVSSAGVVYDSATRLEIRTKARLSTVDTERHNTEKSDPAQRVQPVVQWRSQASGRPSTAFPRIAGRAGACR
jgi:hypothetical protein